MSAIRSLGLPSSNGSKLFINLSISRGMVGLCVFPRFPQTDGSNIGSADQSECDEVFESRLLMQGGMTWLSRIRLHSFKLLGRRRRAT
jgi:hypothetical protein